MLVFSRIKLLPLKTSSICLNLCLPEKYVLPECLDLFSSIGVYTGSYTNVFLVAAAFLCMTFGVTNGKKVTFIIVRRTIQPSGDFVTAVRFSCE